MFEFKLKFNSGRQFIVIKIWYSARQFYAQFGECIGIYIATPQRQPRSGQFGEINMIQAKVDDELVVHELLHFLIDLVRERNGEITPRNEEKIVSEYGDMVKRFWRIYRRSLPID